ncbi:hypothetical protein [Streptomyces bauhiniae]|uniref:hypothetical protein n=1 Tax=Streptomyces bauhiniae TaxID=2340725 RepID=UPI0035DAD2F8
MKRRKHHGREHTYNSRLYVVQHQYPQPNGTWKRSQFQTSDRAQALCKAREMANRGWLISLAYHRGDGTWQTVPVTTPPTRKVGEDR